MCAGCQHCWVQTDPECQCPGSPDTGHSDLLLCHHYLKAFKADEYTACSWTSGRINARFSGLGNSLVFTNRLRSKILGDLHLWWQLRNNSVTRKCFFLILLNLLSMQSLPEKIDYETIMQLLYLTALFSPPLLTDWVYLMSDSIKSDSCYKPQTDPH